MSARAWRRALAACIVAAGLVAMPARLARAEADPPAGGSLPGSDAAAAAAAPAAPSPAPLSDSRFSLEILSGWQVVEDDEDSAMFLKYQDVEEPLVLPRLDLRVRSWDTDFRIDAVDAAEDDAIYRLGVRRPGFFSASLGWDEIPHRISDSGSTLYRVSGSDEVLIPDKIQQTLQAAAFRLETFLKKNAHAVDLEVTRQTTRSKGSISPLPGLTLSLQNEEEQRRGSQPRSVSTTFGNGADVDEFPDPIHYDTRRAGVSLEYRFGSAWVSAAAGLTRFSNGADRLLVDNPLRFTDAQGVSFGNRSAKQFLVSTPPDNEARDIRADAGVALPLGMRFTWSIARGRVDARTDMPEYTSNSAIRLNPFFPDLPSTTIDARIRTSRYDAAFTGTPLKWLSFRVYARGYEYDNRAPVYTFPGYVVADTQVALVRRRALPYGWERKGEGIDLRLRPLPNLSIGAGFAHESVDRTFREVASSDEDTVRLNVDYAIPQWLTLHADTARSDRTADDYQAKAYFASFPRFVPPAQARFLKLKRFDVASRDRSELGVSGVVDLGSGWGFDVESRQRTDDYVDSDYGLVNEGWRSKVIGLTLKPNDPCEIRAEISNEFGTRRVNVRYRPLVFGVPIDARANDWSDELSDKAHTVSGGVVCRDEDDRWDFNVWADTSTDRQTDDAAFHGHAVSDPNFFGHARDHAPIQRKIQRINGRVRFVMSRHTNMVLAGLYEKLVEGDPTQDLMIPTMANADPAAFESAYLGVHVNSYSVRVFSLLVDAHW